MATWTPGGVVIDELRDDGDRDFNHGMARLPAVRPIKCVSATVGRPLL